MKFSMIAALALAFIAPLAHAAPSDAAAREAIQKLAGERKVEAFEKSPIPGYYQAVIGSQMLFPDGVKQADRLGEMGYAGARTISFKRMEYTGHFVMLEQPDYLASVLAAFALSE